MKIKSFAFWLSSLFIQRVIKLQLMFICWCLVWFPAVLCHMYQTEGVHSSLFLLVIHPNERTLQWGCQHSKQRLLQHTVSNYSDAAVSSSGWTSPGVSFYSCVDDVSQVAMFSVCALGVYPKYGPDVVCHEVVVDIQGQGELRVNLNCRRLDHCQAIWMQLFTTFAPTHTHTHKQKRSLMTSQSTDGSRKSSCRSVYLWGHLRQHVAVLPAQQGWAALSH